MESLVNKKAYFDYEILETLEAGIELTGQEVKSIRSGRTSLAGGYVAVKGSELWLIGVDIPPYQPKNVIGEYDSKRSRRLLLRAEQIKELIGETHKTGLTIVPLKLYNKNNRIKVEIGLARHKKSRDKRETIKKKDAEREIRRTLRD